jgi:hypothetical protein
VGQHRTRNNAQKEKHQMNNNNNTTAIARMSADMDLVHKLSKSLTTGSLDDFVKKTVSGTPALLLDVSGSMLDTMRNGRQKIEGLRDAVRDVQKEQRVKMIAFGLSTYEEVGWVDSVPPASGGTPLTEAIDFAKRANIGHAVVISDGEPNDPWTAMESAKKFGGKIDVIYVGNPGDHGETFLRELAAATGGTEFTGDLSQPKEITSGILGLLNAGSDG